MWLFDSAENTDVPDEIGTGIPTRRDTAHHLLGMTTRKAASILSPVAKMLSINVPDIEPVREFW